MIHTDWLIVLLFVLAVARLTHLVTQDFIFDRPRAWLQRCCGTSIAYLVQCPWCLSIWIGGALALAARWCWHTWPFQLAILALAASYATGYLEQTSGLVNAEHDAVEQQTEPDPGRRSPE